MWDILNLYALAGFALFALRKLPARTMLLLGLPLALYRPELTPELLGALGFATPDLTSVYGDAAVLARQTAARAGDYPELVRVFWHYTATEWLGGGLIVGWVAYALGRFLIGAWVGRRRWLEDTARHRPMFRRVALVALPTGLALALAARVLEREYLGRGTELAGELIRPAAALALAAGYVAAIVAALPSRFGQRWLAPFGHAGRMALTNYVAQSFVYGFVLFGVGPGLALAGRIGTVVVGAIVIAVYALQVVFSRWWLERFHYGPLEWLWRALTYGRAPAFRR